MDRNFMRCGELGRGKVGFHCPDRTVVWTVKVSVVGPVQIGLLCKLTLDSVIG